MESYRRILCSIILFTASSAIAKLQIFTTTTTLKAIVEEVAGEDAVVESLIKGTQDPHFIEAKPSYMMRLRKADLLIAVGLDLEIGWLGPVIQGARNPEIFTGRKGYLEVGSLIEPLHVITGAVDRAQGDVHPKGNPHFWLDPVRVKTVSVGLAEKLASLEPASSERFRIRQKVFAQKIDDYMKGWDERVKKTGIKEVVTFHKSLEYFLVRFNVQSVGTIEPKPGIPPTARHIMQLLELMKEKKVRCVLNESYYETTGAERIRKEIGAKIQVVPADVGSVEGVNTFFELIEKLVFSLEFCAK